jgi:hypothetical protein
MKTLKLLPALTTTLFIISIFASCKKDSKPDCNIITITPSSGDAFNFTYNSDGTVSTMSSGTDITTFAYGGNTVIATTTSSGTFSSKKIVTTNANGMATNIRTEHNMSGTDWNNDALEYSGTQLIKSTSTSSSGGTPSVSTYSWTNGNMVSSTSGSSVTTIDYFTDKSAQEGDYLHIAQLVAGYEIYRTKNAIKSITSGSSITSFSYSYDGDGKITSLSATGSSAIIYTYQHQCN